MKIFFRYLVLALLFVLFLVSDSVAADIRPTVAILDFESIGSEEHLGKAVSEIMRTELIGTRQFRVVERSQINKALSEQKFQKSGVINENTAVEIGKLLGADLIIIGSVVKIGTAYTINSRMIDIKTGEAALGKNVTGNDLNLLTNMSRSLIDNLFQPEKLIDADRERTNAERRKIEPEKQQMTGPRHTDYGPAEIKKDGRFISYDNGTVLDMKTNLMWAATDNGRNINWQDAQIYCENYRGGAYSDWRMPTHGELTGLYDMQKSYRSDCGTDAHLTELIRITCTAQWASEIRGSNAAIFGFDPGRQYWAPQSRTNGCRVIPVRSGK